MTSGMSWGRVAEPQRLALVFAKRQPWCAAVDDRAFTEAPPLYFKPSGAGRRRCGQTMRTNPPRCSSSRPLPPRPVTSYLAVLMVCSPPRVVSTVSRSRSPVDAMKPEHAVFVRRQLDENHALAGPREVVHLRRPWHSRPRACAVATITISQPVTHELDADDLGALGRPRDSAGRRAC